MAGGRASGGISDSGVMMEVSFRIFRFDPSRDESPRFESYSIPWEEGSTVLSALRYIYRNIDRTLAYREYECYRGLCNSCRVSVDGREHKGCRTLLEPGREYTLKPLRGRRVIRDLVVDFGDEEKGRALTSAPGA